MVELRISTSEPLFGAFVGALIQNLKPELVLVHGEDDSPIGPSLGVTVHIPASRRWMFVSSGKAALNEAASALAAGAASVVTTDSDPEDFERALAALLSENESYIPLRTLRSIATEATQPKAGTPADGPAQELTARERDVLRLVSLGNSNTEIAKELTISANTVRSHLHALSVKLQATGRMKMLANARALQIPEAFATEAMERERRRASA